MIKLLYRLFFTPLIFYSTILFGQPSEPSFIYKQNSIIQLLNDSTWLKASTEKYLTTLENKKVKKQIDDATYFNRKLQSYVLTNECSKGLKITNSLLISNPDLIYAKVYLIIFHSYFTECVQRNKHAYIPAVKQAFKKAKGSDLDWYQMKDEMNPETSNGGYGIIDYATKDSNLLLQYFKARITSFKNTTGNFSFDEMGNIIEMIAYKKISEAIKEENAKLIKEISLAQTNPYKDVVKEIDKSFLSAFRKNEPGAAIVLMKDNQVLLQKGYGIADITTKKPIDENTNFNVGSISKMFTASAILLLKKEKKLSLSDPIIKYLPDVNPKVGNKINIYQLLTHSSGLPRSIPPKDSTKSLTEMDRDSYNDNKNIDKLNNEPGTKFGYSNIGYRWLSVIVENVSSMKFGDFVRKNILFPANMKNSYELNGKIPIPNFAHAYTNKNKSFSEYDDGECPDFNTLGDGGLVSSVTDFIQWERALRNNRILPKDLYGESIAEQIRIINDNPDLYYGYGWFIEKSSTHKNVYYHSGGNGAFSSYFFRIPEKNIMCAIFLNRDDKPFVYDYVKRVLRDTKWY